MRKCREIAVMKASQAGVTKRARAALAMKAARGGTATKRKVETSKLKFSGRRRRSLIITPENSVSPAQEGGNLRTRTVMEDLWSSSSTDRISVSCCSSNESSCQHVEDDFDFVDLQHECIETSTYRCSRQRREMTNSSDLRSESEDLESTVKQSKADSGHKSTVEKMMPTESEIEEFFSTSEKEIQKNFAEKYNYDIINDRPFKGRYEWIPLKQ